MKKPLHPTPAEMEEWSRHPTAREPVEDWDLIITHEDNLDVIYRLATETQHPGWPFFLGCLYLFVADAWRSDFSCPPRPIVERLLNRVRSDAPPHIRRWRDRSRDLIEGRGEYDYVMWCGLGSAEHEREN